MAAGRKMLWYGLWASLTLGLGLCLGYGLVMGEDKRMFLPGPTTHGHHQIELACGACHRDPFGGGPVLQQACLACHGEELKAANDAHPKSKFNDPRNAELLAELDAQKCVTCHVEHRPEITRSVGLTLPADFCITCHAGIGEERRSHQGMAFETCASAGCHKFHDNRALYHDFLAQHLDEPALRAPARLPPLIKTAAAGRQATTEPDHETGAEIRRDWLETAHAQAGVQCSGCHAPDGKPWSERVGHSVCSGCHEQETEGFLGGLHGMRLKQGLPPMTPAQARLPMHADAAHRELGCTSCHAAHRFDTRHAAVDACIGCHADEHTSAYRQSAHFRLWRDELAGKVPPGSGVSCASCHLPRLAGEQAGEARVRVQHNQNDTLRPGEKMIRPVCLHCHGLGFALDALADPRLARNNFSTFPERHVETLDLTWRHIQADRARRTPSGDSPAAVTTTPEETQQ